MNLRVWRRIFLLIVVFTVVPFIGVAVHSPWLIRMVFSQDPLRYAVPLLYAMSEPEARGVAITAVHFDSGAIDRPEHDDRQRVTAVTQDRMKKYGNIIMYIGFHGRSISKSGKDFGCLIGQYQLHAAGNFYRVDRQKWIYRILSRVVDLSSLLSREDIPMDGKTYVYESYLFDVQSGDIQNYTCTGKTPQGDPDFSRMSKEMKITAEFP